MNPLCIYHHPCADGMTAAWAVHCGLRGQVDLHPANYGDAPPDVNDRDVIMVDFSYKRPVIEAMAKTAKSIVILDHHKSAREELAGLPDPSAGAAWKSYYTGRLPQWMMDDDRSIVFARFDMDRSGGRLAWDFFCGPKPAPPLVQYTEDRDLWRFNLDKSREVSAWLRSIDLTIDMWNVAYNRLSAPGGRDVITGHGASILRVEEKMIEGLIKEGRRSMVIGSFKVPVCNCPPMLASEVAGRLAEDALFAAVYYDAADKRRFSLRSRRTGGADVAGIARRYGGGGHAAAAGFEAPVGWEGDE